MTNVSLKPPKLMGILNVTPDSFYDQSRSFDAESAVLRGIQLAKEGADWIDIGGESTRPLASPVAEEEEIRRTIPVIEALKTKIATPLSIDTTKPKVAELALLAGASFINDVSGFKHPRMRSLAAESGVKICVMHMHETPKTMQNNPTYEGGIIPFLLDWFTRRIDILIQCGIKEEQIFLDPGIGFGKTVADNVKILQNLPRIKEIGFPLLVGHSRKSFLGKIINKPPSDLLFATLACSAKLMFAGVDIIRIHDVLPHKDFSETLAYLEQYKD